MKVGARRVPAGTGGWWAVGRGCTDPRTCSPAVSGLCSSHLCTRIPSPPQTRGWTQTLAEGPGLWVLLPGHRPPLPGPPCHGGNARGGCAQLRHCSARPETMAGFFLCFNQTAAIWSETSRQHLCLQPKQRGPARSWQGCLQKLLLPQHLPAGGQEPGTGATWTSPAPVPKAGLS